MAVISGSEIEANLSTKDDRVRNPAGAFRPEDILQVGLEEERTLEQSHSINSSTSKPSKRNGAKRSPNRSESSASKNSRSLGKRSSIRPIDPGDRPSFR